MAKKTAHSGVVKKSRTEHFCSIRLGTGVFEELPKIANEIRKKFLSEDRELNVTLSTRKLVQWGKLWTQCYGAPSPAQMSLDIALLNRCQMGEREAIDRLCELEFGSAVWTPRPNL